MPTPQAALESMCLLGRACGGRQGWGRERGNIRLSGERKDRGKDTETRREQHKVVVGDSLACQAQQA